MQEVEEVVNQNLVEGKVPCLDGFTINFFHHCWDILKMEVSGLVEKSRQNKWVISSLIATHLTLILK